MKVVGGDLQIKPGLKDAVLLCKASANDSWNFRTLSEDGIHSANKKVDARVDLRQ